jgi:hypothetical protein
MRVGSERSRYELSLISVDGEVADLCSKCDATDTSSCTECSSRNVRCQFTKDTNRRMSSIKFELPQTLLQPAQLTCVTGKCKTSNVNSWNLSSKWSDCERKRAEQTLTTTLTSMGTWSWATHQPSDAPPVGCSKLEHRRTSH